MERDRSDINVCQEMDRYLCHYDFSETHKLFIPSPPVKVYQVFEGLSFRDSWILKVLFFLRGIHKENTFKEMFLCLAKEPPNIFIQGMVGRPWSLKGGLLKIDPSQFAEFDEPDYAKMEWGFFFIPEGEGALVVTETRIRCTDEMSRKKFKRYWRLIRPFSGLTRIIMLRMLRKKCGR